MFLSTGIKSESDYTIRHVCLSVCHYVRPSILMEEFASNWMDIYETEHSCIFRKKILINFKFH